MSKNSISILLNNAIEYINKGQYAKANELLLKAQILSPDNPDILRFLAVVRALKFDYRQALEYIDQAIAVASDNAIAHSNRGNILKELGKYEEALIALDRAIELAPDYAEAYNNKGNVLQEMRRYQESLALYDKAISLQPNYAEAYSNKGNALELLRQHNQAIWHYEQAIAINPRYVDAYWHKAMTELPGGDFLAGWQNYEARWFKTHPLQFRYSGIARLQSITDLAGKNILIWAEQGLGDTLQFSRYIQMLSSFGAQVTFVAPKALRKVLNALNQFCTLISDGEEIAESQFDFQSPLLSLPLVFGTTLETIPAQIPYLDFDHGKKNLFARELGTSQKLKVGVIWNGGFRADSPELWAINKRRNIELDVICRLKDVSGVDFYSLQKGDPAESELRARKEELWPDLINYAHLLNDFSDTAALMECLDLIISVDTSSAHLAGVLGRPVWILNRYDSCWRWLRGRSDSPWYPTAKIYQQNTLGDWIGVIEDVKVDLASLAAAHSKR